MLKYSILSLFLVISTIVAQAQVIKHLSEEPETTTLATNDLVATSTQPGTGFEHTKKMQALNLFNQVGAFTKQVNGLAIGGDSLSTETTSPTATASATGQGAEWPTFALTNSGWRFHLPELNGAIGGSTAEQWNTNYYNLTIHTQAMSYAPWTYWYSHEAGVNDVGSRTMTQVTNDLAGVWIAARADKMFVAAWTVPWDTNLVLNGPAALTWTNVNKAIPTMSALYDVLVQMPVITNATLQLLDNVHPTAAQNVFLAAAFSTATRNTSSASWTNFNTSQISLDKLTTFGILNTFGFRVTGLLLNPYGAGMDFWFDHTSGNSGGGMRTYDITHATFRDLAFQARNFNFLTFGGGGLNFNGNITNTGAIISGNTFYGNGSGLTNLTLPTTTQSPTNIYGNGFNFGVMTAVSQNSNYVVNLTNSAYMSITNSLNTIVNFVHVTNGPGICYIRLKSPDINYFCYFPTNWAWISTNGLGLTGTTYTNYVQVSAHRTGLLTIQSWGGSNPTDVTAKFEVSAP